MHVWEGDRRHSRSLHSGRGGGGIHVPGYSHGYSCRETVSTYERTYINALCHRENQAADVFHGCMDRPGLDTIRGKTIPKDPSDKTKGSYTFQCHKEYVCTEGPAYDALNRSFRAKSDGGAAETVDTVIDAFGPDQIPVKVAIGEHFGLFNRFYSAVPAASSPNHLFAQAATSCGIVGNIPYSACGGSTPTFPPLTIYDSLRLHNVSFGIYYNSTCGLGQNGSCYGPKSPIPKRDGVVSTY